MIVYAVECPVCPACKEFHVNFSFLYRRDPVYYYHVPYTSTRLYVRRNIDVFRLGQMSFSPMAFYGSHETFPTLYTDRTMYVFKSTPRKRNGWFSYHPVTFRHVMQEIKPTLYLDSPIDATFVRDYEAYLATLIRENIGLKRSREGPR